jgi:hypothetical protein
MPQGHTAARCLSLVALAALPAAACGRSPELAPPPAPAGPAAKRLPSPIFDSLSLGMTRAEVARLHSIRPAITAAGKSLRLWVYERKGDYVVHLTFPDRSEIARLGRIDVHYGRTPEPADEFIGRFEARLGAPDVRRREPVVASYVDRAHRQFETIWSDDAQYVFLTERVPLPGRGGAPVYYLTIKKKEITARAPPTGYIPPPPPVDEEGRPIEEPIF